MQSHVTGGDCTKWRSFALFKKSRQNHRFYIWTDALSGMALSPVYPIIRTLNLSLGHLAFLSRYLSRGPLSVYFDYMSELCWLKTGRYVGSQLVNISSKQFSPCLFFFCCCCCFMLRPEKRANFVPWLSVFILHWNGCLPFDNYGRRSAKA